eukprot:Partr_v1_DN28714_c0_g1_i2_m63105 putative protein kinase kinase kinase
MSILSAFILLLVATAAVTAKTVSHSLDSVIVKDIKISGQYIYGLGERPYNYSAGNSSESGGAGINGSRSDIECVVFKLRKSTASVVWIQSFGSGGDDSCECLAICPGGDCLFVGGGVASAFQGRSSGGGWLISKFGLDGGELWHAVGGDSGDVVRSFQVVSDTSLIVGGSLGYLGFVGRFLIDSATGSYVIAGDTLSPYDDSKMVVSISYEISSASVYAAFAFPGDSEKLEICKVRCSSEMAIEWCQSFTGNFNAVSLDAFDLGVRYSGVRSDNLMATNIFAGSLLSVSSESRSVKVDRRSGSEYSPNLLISGNNSMAVVGGSDKSIVMIEFSSSGDVQRTLSTGADVDRSRNVKAVMDPVTSLILALYFSTSGSYQLVTLAFSHVEESSSGQNENQLLLIVIGVGATLILLLVGVISYMCVVSARRRRKQEIEALEKSLRAAATSQSALPRSYSPKNQEGAGNSIESLGSNSNLRNEKTRDMHEVAKSMEPAQNTKVKSKGAAVSYDSSSPPTAVKIRPTAIENVSSSSLTSSSATVNNKRSTESRITKRVDEVRPKAETEIRKRVDPDMKKKAAETEVKRKTDSPGTTPKVSSADLSPEGIRPKIQGDSGALRPRVDTLDVLNNIGLSNNPRAAPFLKPASEVAKNMPHEYSFFQPPTAVSQQPARQQIGNVLSPVESPVKTNISHLSDRTHTTTSDYTTTFTQVQTVIANQRELSIPGFLQYKQDVDYTIRQQVARGGSASIFLAKILTPEMKARANGSPLCIAKVMNNKEPTQQEIASFSQEISIMWFFRTSRNFAKLLGFTTSPPTIIMKHYQRGSLGDVIYNDSQNIIWTTSVIFGLLNDIAFGLKEMHEAGFAHCDIKPGNILIEEDDQGIFATLADFGISRIVSTTAMLVEAFQVTNIDGVSVAYAAPEVLRKLSGVQQAVSIENSDADFITAGDVYSFSMVAYEVINRSPPWQRGRSTNDVVKRVLAGERPAMSAEVVRKRQVDMKLASLCDLVAQCWTDDPRARIQMKWVIEILDQIQNSSSSLKPQ